MNSNWIFKWFMPENAPRSRTDMEMFRFLVFMHLAGPLIAQPITVFLYMVSPAVTPHLIALEIAISSFWALPFILRATGNMTLVKLISFQWLACTSLFGTYFYGGFSSPFLPWLTISLMLGLFYFSRRVALVLGTFALSVAVFLGCVALAGFPDDIPPSALALTGWLSITAAAVYMIWMAQYYARIMALRTELEKEAERYRGTVAELEQARKVADRMNESRSLFLTKMSHELRTPLNAIIGYSEILMEDCADRADTQAQTAKDLSRINAAGKHLLALVSEVLDPDKIESGIQAIDIVEFEVGSLCDDVVATILPTVEKNGNTFVVECPTRGEMLATDRTKLAQILINLLGNAAKFTRNGSVRLSVRVEKSIADERFVATVSDTGIGISPGALPKLFEAYIQADASISKRFGGTGMGLAITRKFCALLGGEISVESEPGHGSVFTVDMPARLTLDKQQTDTASTGTPLLRAA